jgi:hypothetical protein
MMYKVAFTVGTEEPDERPEYRREEAFTLD